MVSSNSRVMVLVVRSRSNATRTGGESSGMKYCGSSFALAVRLFPTGSMNSPKVSIANRSVSRRKQSLAPLSHRPTVLLILFRSNAVSLMVTFMLSSERTEPPVRVTLCELIPPSWKSCRLSSVAFTVEALIVSKKSIVRMPEFMSRVWKKSREVGFSSLVYGIGVRGAATEMGKTGF